MAEYVTPGSHGTTFGGNPLVCRAALCVVERAVQTDFLKNTQGEYLCQHIVQLAERYSNLIVDVRMPISKNGLFVGIEFVMPVHDLIQQAAKRGVLFISAGPK